MKRFNLGGCVCRTHSVNLIRSIKKLKTARHEPSISLLSCCNHDIDVCSASDLARIEQVMLSDVVPYVERFFVVVDSLGLSGLFDAVDNLKKTSVGKEARHRLVNAVNNVVDATAALDVFTTVMSLPGSILLTELLSAEQFLESSFKLLRFGCLRLLSRSTDPLDSHYQNRQTRTRSKKGKEEIDESDSNKLQ